MRTLAWIGVLVLGLIVILYIVAFTPIGNAMLKPFVENKINKELAIQSKVNTFLLTMDSFEISLELDDANHMEAKGSYSLFSKAFDAVFALDLKHLETLQALTKQELRGELRTNGRVKGTLKEFVVNGESDIASSKTTYEATLIDFNPTSIIVNAKDAKLSLVLFMLSQNPYADADMDIDINFRNITPHKLDGEVRLISKGGEIDPKYMLSDFNVTIPKTTFSLKMDAKLSGDDVAYSYDLSSNLFKIASSGKFTPEPFGADLRYLLDIQNLEVLKPLTKEDIRGPLLLEGSVGGSKKKLSITAKSNLASSSTNIDALLEDFKLLSLKVKSEHLDVAKLLYMLKQPSYTNGTLNIEADMTDTETDGLNGNIIASLEKALLNSSYLTKRYEFKSQMPKVEFKAHLNAAIEDSTMKSNIKIDSNLANITMKKALYDMKESSLNSDYEMKIPNMENLFFLTQRHLRGDLLLNGDIKNSKDLDISINSKIAEGVLRAKLHNDTLNANIDGLKSAKFLYMMVYPEVFDATINAAINYDFKQSKGAIDAKVLNGVFSKNKTFDTLKEFTKIDMYRENFNGDIDAKLDKENLIAFVDLRSKEASIKSNSAKLNTKTKIIDADLMLASKKDTLNAHLSGDIDAPKVTIDLEKFLESESGKKVIQKVDKLLQKLLK